MLPEQLTTLTAFINQALMLSEAIDDERYAEVKETIDSSLNLALANVDYLYKRVTPQPEAQI